MVFDVCYCLEFELSWCEVCDVDVSCYCVVVFDGRDLVYVEMGFV